ncbi:MAG: DMT family transporter [Spirochaetales bacterium]|nr:DMT family transporter [Spirochaetales bacterium]
MKDRNNLIAYMSLAGAVLFWGSAYPAAYYLVNRYSLWTIMLIRLVIASIAFLFVPRRFIRSEYRRGDWKKLLPMVLFMPCFYFFFETSALQYTSSVQAGVIAGALPLFVTVGAVLFLKEKAGLPQIAGLALSLGGVIMLTLFNGEVPPGTNPLLGNGLELLAMVCAAGNMLLLKDLYSRYSPAYLTRLQNWGGAIFFLPGLGHLKDFAVSRAPGTELAVLLFLGVACSFGAYFLYNDAQSRIKASSASISINMVPVVALVLGRIFLGETLNQAQLLSSLAVIGGVFLSQLNFSSPPLRSSAQSE